MDLFGINFFSADIMGGEGLMLPLPTPINEVLYDNVFLSFIWILSVPTITMYDVSLKI